ncbi:MAG TPA: hypothetical protein VFK32_05125 [Tepidiformaceae bacterium]|nr:hypothetical protein [Tepidiformaceae bacterium]
MREAPEAAMTQTFDDHRRRLPFAFREIDAEVRREIMYLEASDSALSFGVLYRPAGREAKTVAYVVHPRAEFSRHYLAPGLTERGIAVFAHNTRYVNNDTDMVHERILLDIAAGMRGLRERGFERVVLVGNSGGGSLMGMYQAEAEAAAETRLRDTAGGEPLDLGKEVMPAGDLFIVLAAHPGQGRYMLQAIDPAVVDEANPLVSDRAWDMYNPANGYRPFPEASAYAPEWVAEYRARQRERVGRLDVVAREYVAEQTHFRKVLGVETDDEEARALAGRRGMLGRYMVTYRTLANPAFLDPTIDRSRRPLGSIFAPGDPVAGNYGPGGLGRVQTPRAWLSTWSGLSSRADLYATIARVTVPTLICYADGDTDVFPEDQREMFARSAAADREYMELPWADHYLRAVGEEGRRLADPRERVIDLLAPWIEARV